MSLSRRDFTKSVAAAAAMPLMPAPAAGEAVADAAIAPVQGQQQVLPSNAARALGEYVRIKYGDRLSANDFDLVVRSIDQRLNGAIRLNDPKLANGDEPFFVYRAYRSEG